jgi:hypothetical protein
MATAQYCPPGATTACAKVLVMGADTAAAVADVQYSLQTTGAFSLVDAVSIRPASGGGVGTPSATTLGSYDAVLVYSVNDFEDASLLGDRLAVYHDQGGGVVVATNANSNAAGQRLQGAYGAVGSGYALMDYTTQDSSAIVVYDNDALEVVEAQSPLLTGVISLTASKAYRSSAKVVAGHGMVVARWSSGGREPLVLRGTKKNRTLVELNMFPVSYQIYSGFWSGNGGSLMRNALKYSRCMPCGMGTYAGVGAGEKSTKKRVGLKAGGGA